jgi:hypothetical protein
VTDAYVGDTGVFLRWFFEQPGFEHAREVQDRLVEGSLRLVTTEMARVELAHLLRTRGVRTGRLSREQYLEGVASLDALGVEIVPAAGSGCSGRQRWPPTTGCACSTPSSWSCRCPQGYPCSPPTPVSSAP